MKNIRKTREIIITQHHIMYSITGRYLLYYSENNLYIIYPVYWTKTTRKPLDTGKFDGELAGKAGLQCPFRERRMKIAAFRACRAAEDGDGKGEISADGSRKS